MANQLELEAGGVSVFPARHLAVECATVDVLQPLLWFWSMEPGWGGWVADLFVKLYLTRQGRACLGRAVVDAIIAGDIREARS